MKWTINNQACVATWGALLTLDQNRKAFPNSADVKIGTFSMWATGESSELRAVRARSLASMLDNIFCDHEGARYEAASSKPVALDAMAKVLVVDDKTISELASIVDDNYRFVEEDA